MDYASPVATPRVSSEQPSPEADLERLHNPEDHQEISGHIHISSPVKTIRQRRRIKAPQRFKDYALQFWMMNYAIVMFWKLPFKLNC